MICSTNTIKICYDSKTDDVLHVYSKFKRSNVKVSAVECYLISNIIY